MREIEFRGKQIDTGEWVEGSLVVCDMPIVPTLSPPFIVNPEGVWDVDPATVGQFINIKDKEKKKIFEGDMFCCNEFWTHAVVEHVSGKIMLTQEDGCIDIGEENGFDITNLEIIGNITDNPELLKEKNDD